MIVVTAVSVSSIAAQLFFPATNANAIVCCCHHLFFVLADKNLIESDVNSMLNR